MLFKGFWLPIENEFLLCNLCFTSGQSFVYRYILLVLVQCKHVMY